MIDTKSKTIGEYTFSVTQFGAREGSRWLVVLARIAAKPIAAALGDTGKLDGVSVAAVVAALTEAITPEDFDSVLAAFIAKTTVSGGPFGDKQPRLGDAANFDMVFAGHYLAMLEWLGFCLEVNYADFFGGLPSLAKSQAAPQDSATQAGNASK